MIVVLYISEVERFINETLSPTLLNHKVKELADAKIVNYHVIKFGTSTIELEIPDEYVDQQEYQGVTFYTAKNGLFGLFQKADGGFKVIFQ